jgi:hypothetical protein
MQGLHHYKPDWLLVDACVSPDWLTTSSNLRFIPQILLTTSVLAGECGGLAK